MAHIAIHRVEDIAKRRLARIAQIESMPPAVPRHDGDHWDFNRIGWAKPFIPIREARKQLREAEEPRELGALLPSGPIRGEISCPRHDSFSLLAFNLSVPAGSLICKSSAPIPYPFQILGVDAHLYVSSGGPHCYNLYVSDANLNSELLTSAPSGSEHWQSSAPYGPDAGSFARAIGPIWEYTQLSNKQQLSISGPYPAGGRLVFAVQNLGAGLSDIQYSVTAFVRECANSGREFTFDYAPAPEIPAPSPGAQTPEAPIYIEPPRFWRLS